jgi:hypothetical protein
MARMDLERRRFVLAGAAGPGAVGLGLKVRSLHARGPDAACGLGRAGCRRLSHLTPVTILYETELKAGRVNSQTLLYVRFRAPN